MKYVPSTEWCPKFVEGMKQRMDLSYFKYGAVADAYPHKVNALESLRIRLDKYMDTGNTEFLMDAANFAMIEFMLPSHPDAHYKPTDSDESPGRATYDSNFEGTPKSNDELTDKEWRELHANS